MIREHREDTAATLAYDRNALRAGKVDGPDEPDERELQEHVELGRAELDACDVLLEREA